MARHPRPRRGDRARRWDRRWRDLRHDADGRRVRKIWRRIVHGGQIEEVEKLYLGNLERKQIRRDGAVLLERWTVHVPDGDERIALVHRWTTDTLGREVDAPTTRIHYQLATHQGSAAFELDEDGEIISYEEYFPYGGTAFLAGDDARGVQRKEYRYSGKERDDATGLYDYGHRSYAPWIGRWMSPDPLGPADDLNLYQFVRGDPVGHVDLDGLQTSSAQVKRQTTVVAPEDVPDIPQGTLEGTHPVSGKVEYHSESEWTAVLAAAGIHEVVINTIVAATGSLARLNELAQGTANAVAQATSSPAFESFLGSPDLSSALAAATDAAPVQTPEAPAASRVGGDVVPPAAAATTDASVSPDAPSPPPASPRTNGPSAGDDAALAVEERIQASLSLDDRIAEYGAELDRVWDRDNSRGSERRSALLRWPEYLTRDEFTAYREDHLGFRQQYDRHLKFYNPDTEPRPINIQTGAIGEVGGRPFAAPTVEAYREEVDEYRKDMNAAALARMHDQLFLAPIQGAVLDQAPRSARPSRGPTTAGRATRPRERSSTWSRREVPATGLTSRSRSSSAP